VAGSAGCRGQRLRGPTQNIRLRARGHASLQPTCRRWPFPLLQITAEHHPPKRSKRIRAGRPRCWCCSARRAGFCRIGRSRKRFSTRCGCEFPFAACSRAPQATAAASRSHRPRRWARRHWPPGLLQPQQAQSQPRAQRMRSRSPSLHAAMKSTASPGCRHYVFDFHPAFAYTMPARNELVGTNSPRVSPPSCAIGRSRCGVSAGCSIHGTPWRLMRALMDEAECSGVSFHLSSSARRLSMPGGHPSSDHPSWTPNRGALSALEARHKRPPP